MSRGKADGDALGSPRRAWGCRWSGRSPIRCHDAVAYAGELWLVVVSQFGGTPLDVSWAPEAAFSFMISALFLTRVVINQYKVRETNPVSSPSSYSWTFRPQSRHRQWTAVCCSHALPSAGVGVRPRCLEQAHGQHRLSALPRRRPCTATLTSRCVLHSRYLEAVL